MEVTPTAVASTILLAASFVILTGLRFRQWKRYFTTWPCQMRTLRWIVYVTYFALWMTEVSVFVALVAACVIEVFFTKSLRQCLWLCTLIVLFLAILSGGHTWSPLLISTLCIAATIYFSKDDLCEYTSFFRG